MTKTAVCKCGQVLDDHSEMPLISRDSLGRRVTCFMFQPAEPSPAVPEAQTVPIPRYKPSVSQDGTIAMKSMSNGAWIKYSDHVERIARAEAEIAELKKYGWIGDSEVVKHYKDRAERAEATIAELEASLRKRAEDEYCTYVAAMKRPACLGWKQKIKDGIFGETEIRAHTAAALHLGRHQAFADAASATGKESGK